jgi:hypothetical protein
MPIAEPPWPPPFCRHTSMMNFRMSRTACSSSAKMGVARGGHFTAEPPLTAAECAPGMLGMFSVQLGQCATTDSHPPGPCRPLYLHHFETFLPRRRDKQQLCVCRQWILVYLASEPIMGDFFRAGAHDMLPGMLDIQGLSRNPRTTYYPHITEATWVDPSASSSHQRSHGWIASPPRIAYDILCELEVERNPTSIRSY